MENVVELVIVWGRQRDALASNKCSCHREEPTAVVSCGHQTARHDSVKCAVSLLSVMDHMASWNPKCRKRTKVKHFHLSNTCCDITDTLRDAAVLELRLHHLHGIILQVEVDLALPDPVRLVSCLRNRLLEVRFKTQSLGV